MKNRNLLILLSLGAFVIGFILGPIGGRTQENTTVHKTISAKDTPPARHNVKRLLDKEDNDLFLKKLQSNTSSLDFNSLFEEAMADLDGEMAYLPVSDTKMYLLLKKWGEVAPKQALDKILSTGGYRSWANEVFASWSARDPESASRYFDESQDNPLLKGNIDTVRNIAIRWANFDPQKSWDWLQSQKGKTISGIQFQISQNFIIQNIAAKYPDKISALMDKLTPHDKESSAFSLGQELANKEPYFQEMLKKLPDSAKTTAEAGKIMMQAKGNLNELQSAIETFDPETQSQIAATVAYSILGSSCLDIKERMDWIVEKVPAESWPQWDIEEWFRNDAEEAKAWLDSLPAGDKKERLLNWYKN